MTERRRQRLARILALLSTGALALAPQNARAGAPGDDEATSRQLFKRGEALIREKRWKAACPLFQGSHELHVTRGNTLRLADCYERTEEYERALVLYQRLVDNAINDDSSERVELARARVAALRKQLGKDQPVAVQKPVDAPKPPTPMPAPLWPALVGGGVGLVGIAVGAGLTAAANGKTSSVAQLQSSDTSRCYMPAASVAEQCATLHGATSSRATLSNAAQASFIIGGAFAVASAGLGLWVIVSRRPAPVQVAPTFGATHAGVTLQGRW